MMRYLCFVSLLLLLGCNVGPDYVRPDVDIPASYKEAPSHPWKIATPQDILDQGQWWQIFNDPDLNQLEEQATAANQRCASGKSVNSRVVNVIC